MNKKYSANTNVSINIVMPSGKNLHITFMPLSNGSSVYTTSNEDIQRGIEHHYKYGELFKEDAFFAAEEANNNADDLNDEDASTKEGMNNVSDSQKREVTVSDIASAKDYLAEHCGVSRTAMRSTKSILDQAAINNIEFVGL